MGFQLVDVIVLRPKDPEQLPLLAGRLGIPLPREWLRTLRWAGRAILAAGADERLAEHVAGAARQAGLSVLIRATHPAGVLERFLTGHARALARIAFAAAMLVTVGRLFFVDSYNLVIHFTGLLWLYFVTRDPAIFRLAGLIAGIGTSLVTGYVAMVSVWVALVHVRLAPPLVSAAPGPARPSVLPLPPTRSINWRRLLPVVVGALVVATATLGARRLFKPPRQQGPPAALVASPEARRAQAPLPNDPWTAREELEDRMRSRPDRRFLLAFADLQRLVKGTPTVCAASWAGGTWRIACDGKAVAQLPALPGFADALHALRARARELGGGSGNTARLAFSGMTDDEALAKLRDVRRRWSTREAALHDAAAALVVLSFHALDSMQVADVLPARALAMLALDEESHGGAEPSQEALLASAMGYRESARSIASPLPGQDPVRAYVLQEDAVLESAARAGTPWVKLLWLRRLTDLARTGDAEAWRANELGAQPVSIASLHDALRHTRDVQAQSIQGTLPLVKAALERELSFEREATVWGRVRAKLPRRGQDRPLLEAFEDELNELDDGAPIDGQVVAAFFRGAFYSGVSAAIVQLVDAHGAPEEARSFFASLGVLAGRPAQHLGVWVNAQLPFPTAHEYVQGKPGAETLASSLDLAPAMLDKALHHANDDADASARAARILIARLDTRPEHRRVLALDALYRLQDVRTARAACSAVLAEQGEDESGALLCARSLRDRNRLLAIANSSAANLSFRAAALTYLSDVQLATPQEVDAEFEKLVPLDDGWAMAVRPYAELLEGRREYARARQVVERWLPTPRGASIVEQTMRATRARLLLLEGDPAEAWRELEPLADSQHYGVMMRASYVLSALGRQDEAEALARKRLARMPRDWNSLTVLIELLWRHGKVDEAARTLMHPPFRLEPDDWREQIGPAFTRAFAERPEADVLAAFAGLQRAGVVRRNLRELTVAVAVHAQPGQPRKTLALAMFRRLLESGPADPVALVRTATLMRDVEGEAPAARWLRAHLQAEDVYSVARVLYEQQQHALLWSALPEELAAVADGVWLLRAADAMRSAAERVSRGEALARHFAAPQGSEPYLLGRYVAALSDEASIRGVTGRTRAAWALGARAESEGRRDDAVAWFQVASAGGDLKEVERRFADEALKAWSAESIRAPQRAPASGQGSAHTAR
jgi:tetratricopeptide (TPR) repeat protein